VGAKEARLERQNLAGRPLEGHGLAVQHHGGDALLDELGHAGCDIRVLACVVLAVATASQARTPWSVCMYI